MSVSTEEIFISLKRNGFDISLLEVEKILRKLVEEGFIQREMPQREMPECVTGESFKTKPIIRGQTSRIVLSALEKFKIE
jgi:predicted transcriptional regulator